MSKNSISGLKRTVSRLLATLFLVKEFLGGPFMTYFKIQLAKIFEFKISEISASRYIYVHKEGPNAVRPLLKRVYARKN